MSDKKKKSLSDIAGLQGGGLKQQPQQVIIPTSTVQQGKAGRPIDPNSKRERLKRGELFKLAVTIPTELHQKLIEKAAKEPDKDMSDVVTEILKKHL